MPTIEKLSIALPSEMAAIVRQAVDVGEYSSNSEVVRDALRDWTHKRRLREQGLACASCGKRPSLTIQRGLTRSLFSTA